MVDRTLGVVATIACLVLAAGYIGLSLAGRPTDPYVLFVSGPAVSGLVGAILSRKVNAVAATTEVVKEHVNGLLGARLDHVDEQFTAAAEQASTIASEATQDRLDKAVGTGE